MATGLVEQLAELSLDVSGSVEEAGGSLYFIKVKRLSDTDIQSPAEVNWEVHQRKVTDYLDRKFSTGYYGNITSLGLYNTSGEMTICITFDIPEEEPDEVKAMIKPIPPTVVIPLEDGSFVRLQTSVSSHGPFKHYKEMPQGADVLTDDGHALDTSFDYFVSGHIPVELYPRSKVTFNPKKNLYDFAWCKLPSGADRACLKIEGVCDQVGAPREVEDGETVLLCCRAVPPLQGQVVQIDARRSFNIRGTHINYMSFGFEVDFGQDGEFIGEGLSGSVIIGKSDKALLGMLTGEGHGSYKYMSRHPIYLEWGY